MLKQYWLVVSTPLKNISQIGSFPQVGMKIKNNETTTQNIILTGKLRLEPKQGGLEDYFSFQLDDSQSIQANIDQFKTKRVKNVYRRRQQNNLNYTPEN